MTDELRAEEREALEYLTRHADDGRTHAERVHMNVLAYVSALADGRVQKDLADLGVPPNHQGDPNGAHHNLGTVIRDANTFLASKGQPRVFPEQGEDLGRFALALYDYTFRKREI